MTENISISALTLLENNPRKISRDQMSKLKQSLKEDPDFLEDRPVLVNNIDGKLLVFAGNQRVRAAKALGWKEIPCKVRHNLSEKTMRSRTIKDNKSVGDWDYDILANEYEIDNLIDWGFTPEELSIDVDVIEGAEGEDDNQTLEPPKDPKTKIGDVYELTSESNGGDSMLCHRISCGDSTDPDVVERLLNGNEPILMVTDPPYGVNYDASWRKIKDGNKGRFCKNLGKVQNDDKVNWALAWHLFPGSIAYVWCASWFLPEVAKDLDDCEYERKSLIIWAKQHFALSRGDYHWQHEPCWYAVKRGHKHNWQGSRKECTIWEINNRLAIGDVTNMEEATGHSTQKPLECMAKPIRNNTAKGEGVYDPFLGSGTTLIASEQLGRICYGIELNPAYCDIIVGRWVNYMQKNDKTYSVKRNGEDIQWEPEDPKQK